MKPGTNLWLSVVFSSCVAGLGCSHDAVVKEPEPAMTQERRHNARIGITLPVRVQGLEAGQGWTEMSTVKDASPGGVRTRVWLDQQESGTGESG